MPLEQWEIDLRKQLDKKKAPKPENWEKKLEKEVQTPKKKESVTLFVVILIFLGLSTLLLYDYKSGGNFWCWLKNRFQSTSTTAETPHKPNDDLKSIREEIKKVESQQKDEISKINDKLKTHNNKITLLGMATNENFLIMYNNASRENFIFLGRDWTIDRMPQYLELSEEDKQYLRQFIRAD